MVSGIHLRVEKDIVETLKIAKLLQVPYFQCFLIEQKRKNYLKFTWHQIDQWNSLQQLYAIQVYIHATYWINIAAADCQSALYLLGKEINMAHTLGCDEIVLHAGNAKGFTTKEQGIEQFIKNLNYIGKKYQDCTIILENTAHGNYSIGSDIEDFFVIQKNLEFPERVGYCIDTAHAFSYGYDLRTKKDREYFITLVQENIGWNKVVLMHLNDTPQIVGSKIDQHAVPGEGLIGIKALKDLMNHEYIVDKHKIIEPPPLTFEQQQGMLEQLRIYF